MSNLTQKEEKAVLHYIENGDKSKAYRHAYNASRMKAKTINEAACRLFAKRKIKARVAELQALHAEEHNITVEWLTEKYLETYQMACNQGKAGEAKGVLDSLGKLHGLIVEKKQINGNIQHNHKAESVSETAQWIGGMLGRPQAHEIEASLPN